LGHEVTLREDGARAWQAFQQESFTAVVSDWMMPNMDGLELCKKIRERDTQADQYTYFILLTARSSNHEALVEATSAGVDDFLVKPMNPDQVWMRLKVAERILTYRREISSLEDMLPICSYCKKVRDDQNYWEQVETYISERTETRFSHGICPDCYETHIKPQLRDREKRQESN